MSLCNADRFTGAQNCGFCSSKDWDSGETEDILVPTHEHAQSTETSNYMFPKPFSHPALVRSVRKGRSISTKIGIILGKNRSPMLVQIRYETNLGISL